jgi:hypothetical protein
MERNSGISNLERQEGMTCHSVLQSFEHHTGKTAFHLIERHENSKSTFFEINIYKKTVGGTEAQERRHRGQAPQGV